MRISRRECTRTQRNCSDGGKLKAFWLFFEFKWAGTFKKKFPPSKVRIRLKSLDPSDSQRWINIDKIIVANLDLFFRWTTFRMGIWLDPDSWALIFLYNGFFSILFNFLCFLQWVATSLRRTGTRGARPRPHESRPTARSRRDAQRAERNAKIRGSDKAAGGGNGRREGWSGAGKNEEQHCAWAVPR